MVDHPFFSEFDVRKLTVDTFEDALAASQGQLVGVFFWGHDCPNCEVAKNSLFNNKVRAKGLGIKWFSVNVYENAELGTRFGLHGVPTFFFFHNGKRLGRISPYPGIDPFMEALNKLRNELTPTPDPESN
jgi:thioredoxin-like negative regulator of GroEL